jgi:hypothetical protein
MGPGARPTNEQTSQEAEQRRNKLMEVMAARAKYKIEVDSDTLSLSYELNGSPRLYRLSFDAMPIKGLPKWWLYGGSRSQRKSGTLAIDIIRGSENIAQRPVTQQEAESLTYWSSKRLYYGSIATFACGGLGFYFAQRGRGRMKFPFIKAKPLEQYNHFPTKRVAIATGPWAQTCWQAVRYGVWGQLFILGLAPLFTTVASLSVAAGMSQDSRMKDLATVMTNKGQRDIGQVEWTPQSQQQEEQGSIGDQATAFQTRPTDDARDNFSQDRNELGSDKFYPGGAGDTGTLSDAAIQNRENQSQSQSQSQYEQPQSSYPQQAQRPGQSSRPSTDSQSDPFFYYDASPTAGNDQNINQQRNAGSAWGRLRTQQSSPSSASPSSSYDTTPSRTSSQSSQSSQNANAYSSQSTSTSRDKERAQKEFNDMLERERRQSGSEEYDRGMAAVEAGRESRSASGTGSSGGDGGGNGGGDEASAWERRRRG